MMFHRSRSGNYKLLKLPRKLLSTTRKIGTVPHPRASLCGLPYELLFMMNNGLHSADRSYIEAFASCGRLDRLDDSLRDGFIDRPRGIVGGRVQQGAARGIWYGPVSYLGMRSWVSRTLRVCTGCFVAKPRNPNYWQRKLDEFKNRSNKRVNSNWKKAEKNGSFAKRVEMCCATTSPRCVTRKQGVLETKIESLQNLVESYSDMEYHGLIQQRILLLSYALEDK